MAGTAVEQQDGNPEPARPGAARSRRAPRRCKGMECFARGEDCATWQKNGGIPREPPSLGRKRPRKHGREAAVLRRTMALWRFRHNPDQYVAVTYVTRPCLCWRLSRTALRSSGCAAASGLSVSAYLWAAALEPADQAGARPPRRGRVDEGRRRSGPARRAVEALAGRPSRLAERRRLRCAACRLRAAAGTCRAACSLHRRHVQDHRLELRARFFRLLSRQQDPDPAESRVGQEKPQPRRDHIHHHMKVR